MSIEFLGRRYVIEGVEHLRYPFEAEPTISSITFETITDESSILDEWTLTDSFSLEGVGDQYLDDLLSEGGFEDEF